MSKSKITVLYKGSLEDVLAARNLPIDERIPFAVVKYNRDLYEIYVWYQLIKVDISYEKLVEGYKEACDHLNDRSSLEGRLEFADALNLINIII